MIMKQHAHRAIGIQSTSYFVTLNPNGQISDYQNQKEFYLTKMLAHTKKFNVVAEASSTYKRHNRQTQKNKIK